MFARSLSLVAALLMTLIFAVAAVATPIPGAVVWFDASDVDGDGISGNNPSGGSSISTWVDKASGVQGSQDATLFDGTAPTYVTNMQNGQAALNFASGSAGVLEAPSVSLGALTYFTVFESTGSSLILAERGADLNAGGVYGEFLVTTIGHTYAVKRSTGDSRKNYVADWGNTSTVMSAA